MAGEVGNPLTAAGILDCKGKEAELSGSLGSFPLLLDCGCM